MSSKDGSLKHSADETSTLLSPVAVPAQKQLKYTPGIASSPSNGSAAFNKQPMKVCISVYIAFTRILNLFVFFKSTTWSYPLQMVPIGLLSEKKKLAVVGQGGKLWRWKRSHHQWLLQFKWKWQKPWRLSEWIRHSDETIMRARPRNHPLRNVVWSKQHLDNTNITTNSSKALMNRYKGP